METCEECGFKEEFKVEQYGGGIITFCPKCYNSEYISCPHQKYSLVQYSQNNKIYVRQMCSNCFQMFGSFVKQSGLNLSKIKIIEKEAYDNYLINNGKKLNERYTEIKSLHQEWVKKVWLSKHNDYLNSFQWKEKHDEVLKRDNYLCQACLKRRATQVHHLSYNHWKEEPLFDLVAICKECHDRITEIDRNKQNIIF